MDVSPASKTRWLDIELEGRLISSVVACCVVGLVRWNQVAHAVFLLALSNVIDLIRCQVRKHALTRAIWIHHSLVVALSIVYFQSKGVDPMTEKLLLMEMTNPFLHATWVLSKHPSQKDVPKEWIQAMGLSVLILWPQYRIQNLWPVLQQTYTFFGPFVNVAIVALISLQLQWQSLLVQMFLSYKK